MFIIADESMSVQWDEHFQVLHGIQGRIEIKFLICGISKPIISYTRMTATGCGGWDGVSFSHPESTGNWLECASQGWTAGEGWYPHCPISGVPCVGGGWSPGWLTRLELRGTRGVWLEQNRSQDCREPISHHFTFHSILVSEGEAFRSWPKVEGPRTFWLAACYSSAA